MLRTSGPDISGKTIKRFFTAKNGNKERLAGIAGAVGLDPIVLQHLAHSAEGDYRWLSGGKIMLVRDFDLFLRCSTELGHRGEAVPRLHYECFPYDTFSGVPERYGECPFGKWEDLKKVQPHGLSIQRYAEQVPGMEKIIDDHMHQYIGKTEEIGKMMRLLMWNLFAYSSYGVQPSEMTKALLEENDANLGEFDYSVRMCGADIDYEMSESLATRLSRLEEWSTEMVEDRISKLGEVGDQPDVLTDHLLHHEYDKTTLEGRLRGSFSGGHNNTHCAISGTLVFNTLNDDAVLKYVMENPETNIEHAAREAFRLYSAVPVGRTVQPDDDFRVDGEKVAAGTVVLLSTYAVDTDPLSWSNPMDFDPSRFANNMDDIGYATQRGFAPFGANAPGVGIGGRPCAAQHYGIHLVRTALNKILRDYKFTATGGGYFDFQQNCGGCRYKGNCVVRVERR